MGGDSSAERPRPWFPGGERLASFLLLVAVLYLAYVTLRPVLLVVVLAAALVSLTSRAFAWIARRLGGRRRPAAALMVLALLVGVLGTFAAAAGVVIGRLVAEAKALAQGPGSLSIERVAERLGPLGPPLERWTSRLRPQLAEKIPSLAQGAAQLVHSLGQAVTHLAIGVFLLAITLYYFYLDGPEWRDRLIRLLPLPERDVRLFFARFHQVSVAVLVGNLGTALAQGGVATLGYWILGVPAPLVFGLLTTLAALIPMVGTWLVWAPLALTLVLSGEWGRGLLLAGYGFLIVSTIDNFLRPLLTRRGLQVNPLLIFLAVFGGLGSFGIVGLFFGPLVMALTITVVDLYAGRT